MIPFQQLIIAVVVCAVIAIIFEIISVCCEIRDCYKRAEKDLEKTQGGKSKCQ
jgi:hypothetical protein